MSSDAAAVRAASGVRAAPERYDARLVPAAGLLWSATAAGLLLAWWWALVVAAAGAVAAGLLGHRRRLHRAATLATLAAALLAALVTGARLHTSDTHPLRAAATRGESTTLRVELSQAPKPVFSQGFGNQQGGARSVLVHGTLRAWAGHPSSGRVLLLAPAKSYAGLLPGARLTAHGKLVPPRRGELAVALLETWQAPSRVTRAPWWQRGAESVRTGLRRASAKALPADAAGLLPGLVDGDVSGLPRDLVRDFRTASLTHLNAVSGANLAILTAAVLLLLRALRAGPRLAACCAGLVMAGFVLVTGGEPSVLRAAVMAAIGLLAMLTGRRRAAVPALATAVIVLVGANPEMALNLGFLLSVLATAALVWLAPRWTAHLAGFGVPLRVAEAVAIPAAAQLVTTPVIAGMSGRISVVGVLANMLAEPAVPAATVLGVLAAAVAPAWAPAAQGFALLAGPPLQWLIWVAHTTAGFPIASLPWPGGLAGGLLLAAVLAAAVVCLRWRRLRVLMLAGVLLALVVVVPVKLVRPGWPPAGWAMVDCDVGQGDAEILATARAGRVVLVDTGPEGGDVTDCLDRLGVRAVSMVLLSHLHADHMGGLAAVLDDVPVGAVAVGRSRVPGWAWQKVRSETTQAHVPLVALTRGQRLSWPGLSLDVIAPLPGDGRVHDDSPDGTEINNTSVVLRARTVAGSILLTGDIELGTQADLLASHANLTADVLKIPHHGSRYSLTRFLAAVHSRIAVASVGAGNSYGHPSPLTLSRLRRDGALVLRTDKAGSVAIVGRHGTPEAVRRGNPKPAP